MGKVFEPIQIGKVTLKNRIVALPVVQNFATDEGKVTPQMVSCYRRRAEGGAGLVTVEATYIRPDGNAFWGMHAHGLISTL
ncbi:hypothetical protein MFMK1_002114 [Metallumcola ferriviriculae]|uniref:NADH:flavin oxidoreductase/NADH oxidase N-terminal domain-containing protein n=1 Tax=Metallumcola ferriviriculae TaxID=3039180 RepID=A0AAU0USN6_9FIRM|nr:hypothetical protein MFMK1_002114 [Desulfitibacteraceae bacterium MK1]